jgi:hypothetical protein
LENLKEEADKKSESGCACQCHNQCGACKSGCGHCGFWKGLIIGVALCALIMFICDRVCENHMGMVRGYYNSPSMTQNAEPDNHMNMKNK